MTILEKIYPNYKIIGLGQMIVEGSGWYDTLITDKNDIITLARKGYDAAGRKIRCMAIRLEDPDGFHRIADFIPEDLI